MGTAASQISTPPIRTLALPPLLRHAGVEKAASGILFCFVILKGLYGSYHTKARTLLRVLLAQSGPISFSFSPDLYTQPQGSALSMASAWSEWRLLEQRSLPSWKEGDLWLSMPQGLGDGRMSGHRLKASSAIA